MTIGGWIGFVVIAVLVLGMGGCGMYAFENTAAKVLSGALSFLVTLAVLLGMLWFFNNTASGQRALTDQRSELANGLERTITVYTADGNIIAQYTGRIDIEGNDGGYVLFDFEGKRYTYYNCFVESVANID